MDSAAEKKKRIVFFRRDRLSQGAVKNTMLVNDNERIQNEDYENNGLGSKIPRVLYLSIKLARLKLALKFKITQ